MSALPGKGSVANRGEIDRLGDGDAAVAHQELTDGCDLMTEVINSLTFQGNTVGQFRYVPVQSCPIRRSVIAPEKADQISSVSLQTAPVFRDKAIVVRALAKIIGILALQGTDHKLGLKMANLVCFSLGRRQTHVLVGKDWNRYGDRQGGKRNSREEMFHHPILQVMTLADQSIWAG